MRAKQVLYFIIKIILGEDLAPVKLHLIPPSLVAQAAVRSKAVVLSLLIHCFMYPPIVCGGSMFVCFCYALLSVLSSFVIILMRKRELVALL